MGTRRMFSRENKLEAVKVLTDRGVAVTQAARDLGDDGPVPEPILDQIKKSVDQST